MERLFTPPQHVIDLALTVGALAAPALLLGCWRRVRPFTLLYASVLSFLACMYGLVHAAQFLLALRPQIQGTDFFTFLCGARDALDELPVTANRYAYFPGLSRFWQLVLASSGRSLVAAQWAYVAVLATNAVLLGVTAKRCGRGWALPVVATLGYVWICARAEGAYGIAEPISSLPILLGVAIWGGESLRGRRGLLLGAALGVGIGLAAYVKQQGGLQSLGWVGLVGLAFCAERDRRHQPLALALIPGLAALAFLVGILAEGHGLFPLRVGLQSAQGYDPSGSLRANLDSAFRQLRPLVIATCIASSVLPVLLLRGRQQCSTRWLSIVAFSGAAAVGTLLEYTKRGYAHYALLTAPWMLLSCVVVASALSERYQEAFNRHRWLKFAALFVAALPFVRAKERGSQMFYLWPPAVTVDAPDLGHPWLKRDMAEDIERLASLVHSGEDILILPPRHNELHFLWGTRSRSFALGYGWGALHVNAEAALASKTLAAVVELRKQSETDRETCVIHDCPRAVASLPANGFHRVATLRTLTLWRRD